MYSNNWFDLIESFSFCEPLKSKKYNFKSPDEIFNNKKQIIMKPKLKDIKKYFKNAKEVKSLFGSTFELKDLNLIRYSKHENNDGVYYDNGGYEIWCNNQYAEIISYKEETVQVPLRLIKEFSKEENIKKILIREGIIEEDKLELNKWYKSKNVKNWLCFNGENGTYGFNASNNWTLSINLNPKYINIYEPTTEQEVFEAFKKEAVKKYNGRIFKSLMTNTEIKFTEPSHFNMEENSLWVDGYNIFKDGVWSAVILEETYVKIPLSKIKNNPNDMLLGKLVRNIANNY